MTIELRQGRAADAQAIFRVMEAAFKLTPGTAKWRQRKQEAEDLAAEFRVLTVDGRVVSVAHVGTDRIQIGSCVVVKGDVGEVSTLPEFERRGLATRLMNDVVGWMRAQGFHLTRLGGYCRFYERFGYVPFPRGLIQFPLAGLGSRGGYTDPEDLLSDPGCAGTVRLFRPVADHAARAKLYHLFNAGRTGAVPRTFGDPPREETESPWRIAFERDEEMLGYLLASEQESEHSLFEGKVQIHEAAVDPAHPEVLVALLRHTLLHAHRCGATRVTARLPLDYSLYDAYRLGSLGFVPMLWQSTESSNMLSVLDLQALLRGIAPELERRLRASLLAGWEGEVDVRVGVQAARIVGKAGQLSIAEGDSERAHSLETAGFLHLLFGLRPAEEVLRGARDPATETRALLSALFPVQPTATGVWG